MPPHIVAFGASTSTQSINKRFAAYAVSCFPGFTSEILDLNDYPLPLFSVDLEKESGIPAAAVRLYEKMVSSDLLIISLAEHNGSYTAAFKNAFDWVSRHVTKCLENKPMFLLSTSPGQRGGKGVMDAALIRFPIHGAIILDHFSLPGFHANFSDEDGILPEDLRLAFAEKVTSIQDHYGLENF